MSKREMHPPRGLPRVLGTRLCGLLVALVAVLTPAASYAGFGLSEAGADFVVDSGAGLVFKVAQGSGTITSLVWQGTEMQGPKPSGLASGFGGVAVAANNDGSTIVITCTTDSGHGVIPDLTHYYIVRKMENTIYMATHAPKGCTVGELRWITRVRDDLFPETPVASDIRGTIRAIESRDVSGNADGTTRSKYYGNQHAKDLDIRGITGPGRGLFMAYGNREGSSGGPFYRDIQNQTAEVYNYMYSGHGNPDVRRHAGLHGPYALCFTTGAKPAVPDMKYIAGLGLKAYVGPDGRGGIICPNISGRDTRHRYTIGFTNDTAQYWATAGTRSGGFQSPAMKPGRYTMRVYKNELAVTDDTEVVVEAGKVARLGPIKITGDPGATASLWRIGDWDGTPLEFLNGNRITNMHPSDTRMSSWNPGTFVVGSSAPARMMQACQWKDVPGNDKVIEFQLTPGQIKDSVLRIGITCATGGARPCLAVNSWHAPSPRPSPQPVSRTFTVGTYRGNNTTFTFAVPAKALLAGTNTLRIGPLSGSGGHGYLSPGYAIDCIDFTQDGVPSPPAK